MNALDSTARGLAIRALGAQSLLASPTGASSIGTSQGATAQETLDGYSTRTAIKALQAYEGSRAYLSEGGRQGDFIFRVGDYSPQIAADTAEGLFIAPDSDPSGASGAWVRQFFAEDVDFRWFGPSADGLSDDTPVWSAAIAVLKIIDCKRLHLPAASIVLGSAKCCDGLQVSGAGWTDYDVSTVAAKTSGISHLVRRSDAARVLDLAGAKNVQIANLDLDGNGGAENGFGDGLGDSCQRFEGLTAGANGLVLRNVKAYDCQTGFAGDAGNPIANCSAIRIVARDNNTGIAHFCDSDFSSFTLSSNHLSGAYINSGQLRFSGGFIEWNFFGDTAAHGFIIDRNATEVLITGCQFDHNSGNDVRLLGSGNRAPAYIKIVGNLFKGAGWAPSLNASSRTSIFCNSVYAAKISIVDNDFQVRDFMPSGVEGYRSPHQCVSLPNQDTRFTGNSLGGVGEAWDLSNIARSWVRSENGVGEYYLRLPAAANGNPWIDVPDFLEHGSSQMTKAAAGSLLQEQWAWADNDGLGFATVYVRLPGDADPAMSSIFASFAQDPVLLTGSNVQTDGYRDRWRGTSFTTTQTFTLKTRQKNYFSFSYRYHTLRLFGRRHGVDEAAYEVGIIVFRSATGAMSVKLGDFVQRESGFTIGAPGSGQDLELSAIASKLGEDIAFTLSVRTAATYTIEAQLVW
jgi:hypothetical protein